MSWRDHLAVHPAADLFPKLNDGDLVALGEDIKRNGLSSPVAIQIKKNGEAVLLDGRNRLDAMERIGLRVRLEKGKGNTGAWKLLAEEQLDGKWVGTSLAPKMGITVVVITTDPIEYITSANVHRRHLMPGEKRDVVAALLKERPERSNLQTAKIAGVDDKTVASVRRDLEGRSELPNVAKTVDTMGRRQPTSKPKARPVATKPTSMPTEPTQQHHESGEEVSPKQHVKKTEHDPSQEQQPVLIPTPEQRWHRSLMKFALEAKTLPAVWSSQFGDWKTFAVPSAVVAHAKQTAEAWAKIARDLEARCEAAKKQPAAQACDDLDIPTFLDRRLDDAKVAG
jgi:hypothetical protein